MPVIGWPVSQALSIILSVTALSVVVVKRMRIRKKVKAGGK